MRPRLRRALFLAVFSAIFDPAIGQIGVSDCATCHQSIAAEWRNSLHSEAYSTLQFRVRKEKTVEPSCGCHAPDFLAPDNLGKSPPARQIDHASGVDCTACHLDHEMAVWSAGPRRFVPHWTQQSEIYSSGQFCAGCHTWARDSGDDCSSCHMPAVDGPVADGPLLQSFSRATHLSHRWTGSSDPDLVSSAISLAVDASGDEIAIEITNRVYAHKFPATDHRKVALVLVDRSEGELIWEEQVVIPASSTVSHRIRRPAVPTDLSIQLRYHPTPEVDSDKFFVLETRPLRE